MITLEMDMEREATTRRKPTWLRDAAEEIFTQNIDRDLAQDEYPSAEEIMGIFLKHFYGGA